MGFREDFIRVMELTCGTVNPDNPDIRRAGKIGEGADTKITTLTAQVEDLRRDAERMAEKLKISYWGYTHSYSEVDGYVCDICEEEFLHYNEIEAHRCETLLIAEKYLTKGDK